MIAAGVLEEQIRELGVAEVQVRLASEFVVAVAVAVVAAQVPRERAAQQTVQ